MPDGCQDAHEDQLQPNVAVCWQFPNKRQGERTQSSAHPSRQNVHRDGVFCAGHFAGEQLKAGVGHNEHQGKDHNPIKVLTAWPHDAHGACKSAQDQSPTKLSDFLAQRQSSHEGDHQRGDRGNGSELAHGHVLHPHKHTQAAAKQQDTPYDLKFGMSGFKQLQAPAGQVKKSAKSSLDKVSEPKR